ncbi:MAG: glycosyltransferase, partial [Rhodospirillales bacterium]|nr:glycosyltransferase [Rhodospirillales bacterium]
VGAMKEMVEEGKTGLRFAAGNPAHLVSKVRWAQDHPDEMTRMGAAARKVYEQHYTPEENFRKLTTIYNEVLQCRRE